MFNKIHLENTVQISGKLCIYHVTLSCSMYQIDLWALYYYKVGGRKNEIKEDINGE